MRRWHRILRRHRTGRKFLQRAALYAGSVLRTIPFILASVPAVGRVTILQQLILLSRMRRFAAVPARAGSFRASTGWHFYMRLRRAGILAPARFRMIFWRSVRKRRGRKRMRRKVLMTDRWPRRRSRRRKRRRKNLRNRQRRRGQRS